MDKEKFYKKIIANKMFKIAGENPNIPWDWVWFYIFLTPDYRKKERSNPPSCHNLKEIIENIKISYIKRFNLINYRLNKRFEYCKYSREILERNQK